MKLITSFLINGELNDYKDLIEFKKYDNNTIIEDIKKANGKYITFIKDINYLSDHYFEKILKTATQEFDVCTINYTVEIDGEVLGTEKLEKPEIQRKPYIGDYIWSYIWKKEKIIELLESNDQSEEKVDEIFHYVNYIEDVLIHHVPSKKQVENFIYTDEKEEVRRKNMIYMGTYCNGQFNGYITWLNNIGRCFGKDYKITILYDKIYEPTKKSFERYFEVIPREENKLYIASSLSVTYSTYYYPKNILVQNNNYMFIHGNMCDYPSSRKYEYDNYTKYIGVSKISAEKAKGYFPTDEFDSIMNPIKIDKSLLKPHLRLVSALRNDPIKKIERVHYIAQILDEEEIPYTWNIFIDSFPYEHNVYGGVIYRHSVQNPLPYIKDADYFVQLSDSEACSYSVLEALSLNTKVILTPLECYEEMNVDKSVGYLLPFDIFEEKNKEKLREVVLDIYHNKDRKIQNKLDPSMWEKYNEIFEK